MKDKSVPPGADPKLREYAAGQTAALLRRTAFQANRAARLKNAAGIHDLRVSIRRLSQALRLFAQFFPRDRARKLRRRLASVMDLASKVRDCDVALGLIRGTGIPAASPLVGKLQQERGEAEDTLFNALKRWSRRDFEKRWRSRLEL